LASPVCPAKDGQLQVLTTAQAYVLAPSSRHALEASLGPFDYGKASALWSSAFVMVVGLFVVSRGIGSVLQMLRRG
jgi:hypothetical protein